jgi:O-acetyl-ADP-ribose deacetylase (regulator of RNase III)
VIRVVVDNLATVRVDAIVRPATTTLTPVSPPIQDLEDLGAPSFQSIRLETELAVGSAIVTEAGNLAANMVIHAIIAGETEPASEVSVRRAMDSILHRASAWHMTTVGLPLTDTGFGGISTETATRLMVSAIRSHENTTGFPQTMVLVVSSDQDKKMVENISGDLIE